MEASYVTHSGSSPPQTSFSAFERFFREQYPVVVRIAFGVVGDAQVAQDVAQDVFISAFRRFPDLGEPDHACGWVRAATVLVLRHNGLSYAEVAEAMNVKVGHVGTMLRRAESALRKELKNAPRA